MTIREITPDEYARVLKDQIHDAGIKKAIREQLDEWVSICHPLGYLGFSEAVEMAQNIMDLLNTYIDLKRRFPNSDLENEPEEFHIPDEEEECE